MQIQSPMQDDSIESVWRIWKRHVTPLRKNQSASEHACTSETPTILATKSITTPLSPCPSRDAIRAMSQVSIASAVTINTLEVSRHESSLVPLPQELSPKKLIFPAATPAEKSHGKETKTVRFLPEMEGVDTAAPFGSGQGGVGDTSDCFLHSEERMMRKLVDETKVTMSLGGLPQKRAIRQVERETCSLELGPNEICGIEQTSVTPPRTVSFI